MHLTTADGVRLAARVDAGPPGTCVVLAHGFGMSSERAAVRRIAQSLARRASVLSYDARGHGRSGGASTVGIREALDVDAAVAAARVVAPRVVTVGFSMGGAAVVRQAALRGGQVDGHDVAHPPDAVVAVSSTARWSDRATATRSMRRLHRLVETRSGRVVARTALRTRIATSTWDPLPEAPVDLVAQVAPIPLLVVHGDRDAYFPVQHALDLAAAGSAELWLEPGFAHAETAVTDALLDRLADRVAAA